MKEKRSLPFFARHLRNMGGGWGGISPSRFDGPRQAPRARGQRLRLKWVEFLKLVAPQVTRAALLFNPETAPYAQRFYDNLFTKAAQQIGVEASAALARSEAEIDNLIEEIGRSSGGLCVMADPFTSKYVSRIVDAVARERGCLPSIRGAVW